MNGSAPVKGGELADLYLIGTVGDSAHPPRLLSRERA